MKTVAIISEYNPFHSGHEYQIQKIREEFGQDTRIIAIMSGNYTQRGETAIMDKSLRAACAVNCGVNLVLELPFPYSASSAEFFAKSGVKIANSLGLVDYLCFGSELGEISELSNVARNMTRKEYQKRLKDNLTSKTVRAAGYPEICQYTYNELYGDTLPKDIFSPNNILAIEYIKALIESKSNILPHTIKRLGAGYSETNLQDSEHQSASAIREMMSKDVVSAMKYMPNNLKNLLVKNFNNKNFPCNVEKLSTAVISHFRLNLPMDEKGIHDAGGGLYNRLQNASLEATTLSKLTELADTKKYTAARIRRAIWFSFFGVTSSEVKMLPLYTQTLAMDTVGKSILKEAKKISDFPILTKPSAYGALSQEAKRQKLLSDKADSIFQLSKPKAVPGNLSLLTSPYIKD